MPFPQLLYEKVMKLAAIAISSDVVKAFCSAFCIEWAGIESSCFQSKYGVEEAGKASSASDSPALAVTVEPFY